MAAHGRTGEALAAHRRRRRRLHVVPGVYLLDGSGKPTAMTHRKYVRRLRLKGDGEHKGKVPHDKPYYSLGLAAKRRRST